MAQKRSGPLRWDEGGAGVAPHPRTWSPRGLRGLGSGMAGSPRPSAAVAGQRIVGRGSAATPRVGISGWRWTWAPHRGRPLRGPRQRRHVRGAAKYRRRFASAKTWSTASTMPAGPAARGFAPRRGWRHRRPDRRSSPPYADRPWRHSLRGSRGQHQPCRISCWGLTRISYVEPVRPYGRLPAAGEGGRTGHSYSSPGNPLHLAHGRQLRRRRHHRRHPGFGNAPPEEFALFLDIGTNGEVVLGNRDFLVACSASAGPAFEGGSVSCGMRATSGAIDSCGFSATARPSRPPPSTAARPSASAAPG